MGVLGDVAVDRFARQVINGATGLCGDLEKARLLFGGELDGHALRLGGLEASVKRNLALEITPR